MRKLLRYLPITLSFFFGATANALESTRLSDVIKSNGIGDIDIMMPASPNRVINGPTLEAFRLNNDGNIVFAIDVNEAANGTEKASSQGVTIKQATLTFSIGDAEYSYSLYNTKTKSLLAEKGSLSRSLYYTLIGDTGSSRITNSSSSDINNSSFDATLSFPVDIDLSNTSAATLHITLLDTDVALGDPEAFYDFSNGYEDIALVTADDAAYLDNTAAGQDEAPLVLPADSFETPSGGTIYYPSQSGYYIAAYEDMFPHRGDYDFNDLVVGYRIYVRLDQNSDVISINGEGYLIARGAGFNHDWHLRIDLPDWSSGTGQLNLFLPDQTSPSSVIAIEHQGDLDIIPFEQTRRLWVDSGYETVNTLNEQSFLKGHRFTFTMPLNTPVPLTQLNETPYDPYLYVHDTGYEIHMAGKTAVLGYSRNTLDGHAGFTDALNYPYAMVFNENWLIPIERIDLGLAYPNFVDYIQSNNTTSKNWHQYPASDKTKPFNSQAWKW